MNFEPIAAASPQIQIHLFAALFAFVVGTIILLNRKGTNVHKAMGWTFVVLMALTAASAIFIRRTEGIPNIAGFTPIHLFVALTAVSLPMAIVNIKRGRVRAHAASMIGLFIGALVIAGALTLLPGRIMHSVFFG
jgi:uncharacterized membrane protein